MRSLDPLARSASCICHHWGYFIRDIGKKTSAKRYKQTHKTHSNQWRQENNCRSESPHGTGYSFQGPHLALFFLTHGNNPNTVNIPCYKEDNIAIFNVFWIVLLFFGFTDVRCVIYNILRLLSENYFVQCNNTQEALININ